MNSTISNSSLSLCDRSDRWWYHQNNAYVFAYKIVTPIYFLFGIFGHSLSFLAFSRQAKKDKPYAYQIFLAVNETMEIFAFACFSLSFRWFSGIENRGADWYQKSYFLMWYAAHVSFPVLNAFITTNLLLSVSMAADRLFAMTKPFVYKTMKSRRHQMLALSISVFIGFSTSIFDAFRFHVVEIDRSIVDQSIDQTAIDRSENRYKAEGDNVYMQTFGAIFLAHLRDSVRVGGLALLILCNAWILYAYRSRLNKTKKLTKNDDVKRQKEKQAAENTLLLLTISQSILKAVGMSFLITFYVMIYVDPNFLGCGGLLMAPCLDATLQLASILDFYFVFCTSKQFRTMIFDGVKKRCGQKGQLTTMVTAIVQQKMGQTITIGAAIGVGHS